jgi:hypothetical protein
VTLLLAEGDLEKYNRAALRWHVRFLEETKNVDIREGQAVLALLTAIPANALAAAALPSSRAAGDRASGSPRLLSGGRGQRRPRRTEPPLPLRDVATATPEDLAAAVARLLGRKPRNH